MDLSETYILLQMIAEYDARVSRNLQDDGEVERHASLWCGHLTPVEFDFAVSYVRRWYGDVERRRAVVDHSNITKAWGEQRRRDESVQHRQDADGPELVGHITGRMMPSGFREWVERMTDEALRVRHERAGVRGPSVRDAVYEAMARMPHPESLQHQRTLTTAQQENDRRARDCRQPLCSCAHTECRGGWLDEEVGSPRSREGTAATRCPQCQDAIIMAGEGVGKRRRSR